MTAIRAVMLRQLLIRCCHHLHHNQLLDDANFVHQRTACFLFSGHLELEQNKITKPPYIH